MAEAEDVITDAARHATIYARDLWLRKRSGTQPELLVLAQAAASLDLMINAVFGLSHQMRPAQPPAIPTLLTRLFRRHAVIPSSLPMPATDCTTIWLHNTTHSHEPGLALEHFR